MRSENNTKVDMTEVQRTVMFFEISLSLSPAEVMSWAFKAKSTQRSKTRKYTVVLN